MSKIVKVLFSDYFSVSEKSIEEHGTFNISLVTDLPLFIDPFLLFNSKNETYIKLHRDIIRYLEFLRDKSLTGQLSVGLIANWYRFKEVHQTWLGFSISGNKGSGLGYGFANALNLNFGRIFKEYGKESITKGTHLEKLCLIEEGVGRDNISDFTTNLIKHFLATYTQDFAKKYISPQLCRRCIVDKSIFNYETESWEHEEFLLPWFNNDYVLLTPRNILTKDQVWIDKAGLHEEFDTIRYSLEDTELRNQLENYIFKMLGPGKHTKKQEKQMISRAFIDFPQLIDHYIRHKEDNGDSAVNRSNEKIDRSQDVYLERFKDLVELIRTNTEFDKHPFDSFKENLERAKYVKHVIENCDGYKLFYEDNVVIIRREDDLRILYRMTWYASSYDLNTEVNNGRGPADAVTSKGSVNKSLTEFKLASNSHLKANLENQTKIYALAGQATHKTVYMILYFTMDEQKRVKSILKELNLESDDGIVLIDARNDNKPSASTVR